MIELFIVIMIILLLLYIIHSNSFYMNLHQTDLNDILRRYDSLSFLNTVKTIIVIETNNLHDKTLEVCIKSIFNQNYRINNLYVITKHKGDIPNYIKNTSVVVESYNDIHLLEPEETSHFVYLQNIEIIEPKEFVRLCKV